MAEHKRRERTQRTTHLRRPGEIRSCLLDLEKTQIWCVTQWFYLYLVRLLCKQLSVQTRDLTVGTTFIRAGLGRASRRGYGAVLLQ